MSSAWFLAQIIKSSFLIKRFKTYYLSSTNNYYFPTKLVSLGQHDPTTQKLLRTPWAEKKTVLEVYDKIEVYE